MTWTLRVLLCAVGALILMPGAASASREEPECECESLHWDTIDKIWAGEAVEEFRLELAACPDLRVYRNIPYAREGLPFQNEWVLSRFTQHEPRYKPIEGMTDVAAYEQMSDVDKALIASVLKWEETYECQAYWKAQKSDGDGAKSGVAEVAQPEYLTGHYEMVLLDPHTGVVSLTITEVVMDPNFLIGRAFGDEMIESEWLVPLTCSDLQIVSEAVRGRSSQPSNQDKLSLLRIDRDRRDKGCGD